MDSNLSKNRLKTARQVQMLPSPNSRSFYPDTRTFNAAFKFAAVGVHIIVAETFSILHLYQSGNVAVKMDVRIRSNLVVIAPQWKLVSTAMTFFVENIWAVTRPIVSVPYPVDVAGKMVRTHSTFSAVEGFKQKVLESSVVNAPPCAARTVSSSAWAPHRPKVKDRVVRDGVLLAQAKILK
jgi:hypothetical protein